MGGKPRSNRKGHLKTKQNKKLIIKKYYRGWCGSSVAKVLAKQTAGEKLGSLEYLVNTDWTCQPVCNSSLLRWTKCTQNKQCSEIAISLSSEFDNKTLLQWVKRKNNWRLLVSKWLWYDVATNRELSGNYSPTNTWKHTHTHYMHFWSLNGCGYDVATNRQRNGNNQQIRQPQTKPTNQTKPSQPTSIDRKLLVIIGVETNHYW